MSAVTLPDIEAAVIEHLLDDVPLSLLVSDRIYAELPDGWTHVSITVRRISGRGPFPRWVDAALIEVSAWGIRGIATGRQDTRDACEAAVAALAAVQNTIVGDAVLSVGLVAQEPRSLPDVLASGVTNPRFIGEVAVTYHPVPSGS